MIPPAPMPMGTGTDSVVGWINLTTSLLRRFASFSVTLPFTLRQPEGQYSTSLIRNWFQSTREAREPMRPRPPEGAFAGARPFEDRTEWDGRSGAARFLANGKRSSSRRSPVCARSGQRTHLRTLGTG